MKLKCISPALNMIVFDESKKPHRVRVGETFTIGAKTIPAKWRGLVIEVGEAPAPTKVAVTNPAAASPVVTEQKAPAAPKPPQK